MELMSSFFYFISLFLLLVMMFGRSETRRKVPPGPRPLPLIGNLLKLGENPHKSLANLAKIYGPVMYLRLGQKSTIVISSATIAKQIFQKQDLIFSTRSVPNALDAHDFPNCSVVWMSISTKWQKLRKIINIVLLQTNKLNASQNLRQEKVHDLLAYAKKCCEEGAVVDIGHAAFITSLNMLSDTIFSKNLTEDLSSKLRHAISEIMANSGKKNLADFFPALGMIDLQGLRCQMKNSFEKMFKIVGMLIDERIESRRVDKNNYGNNVLDTLLNMVEDVDRTQIERLITDFFLAGTDTTSSTIEWAMAELLRNSKVLNLAKTELDETIGRGKPIEESDIASLPYLQAVVKETLRMHPPTPFHARIAGTDIVISEYEISKGSEIIFNIWAMCRDPGLWDNPTLFDPQRFMGSDIDVRFHDCEQIPFGFGRRSCPGKSLASRTIAVMVGSLVNSFDWKLESEVIPEELNMEEKFGGLTIQKAQPLRIVPI